MRSVRAIIAALLFVPVIALAGGQADGAAEESSDGAHFRVINPSVDAWAAGTVTKVADGQIEISGANLPFLTARAQMHQELRQKLAGIEDPQQRFQMAKQIKHSWSSKLEAASSEKRSQPSALSFKTPSEAKELVVLDGKSIRELPFFQRMEKLKEAREKLGVDQGNLADLYQAHEARMEARAERRGERPVSVSAEQKRQAAEKISEKGKERMESAREKLSSERLSASDLKVGDKVLIGFNSDGNTAFTIIRSDGK